MRARMGGMKFCREGHAAGGGGAPQANGWVRACSPSCRRAGERSSPLRRWTVTVCNRREESINLFWNGRAFTDGPLAARSKSKLLPSITCGMIVGTGVPDGPLAGHGETTSHSPICLRRSPP